METSYIITTLSLKTHLLGLFQGDSLLLLGLLVLRLLSHDATTPGSSDGDVLVVLTSESLGQGIEIGLVLLSDGSQAQNSGVLLVDEGAKSCLALQDAEWNILLSAKGWEPANKLDWVNIVSDDDELSFLVLDQRGDLVDTVLDSQRLLLLRFFTGGLGLGNLLQTHLLLLGSLRRVLFQQLDELSGLVLVQSVGELVNHRRDLQSLEENLLLSLKIDVLGPSDVSGQVLLGLDIVTDIEVSLHHSEELKEDWKGIQQHQRLNIDCDK